MEVSEVL